MQLTEAGKVPASLLPFTALEFQGTHDASGGTNPVDGVDNGEFYVINVAGTLTVFVDNSGTPVATAVEPGDYLLWLNTDVAAAQGWYYITRETPVFIDSDNVTYDPTNERWIETTVQDVLDEISERVGIRDETETITGIWTFNSRVNFVGPPSVVNDQYLFGGISTGGDIRMIGIRNNDILEIGQLSSALLGIRYDAGAVGSSHVFEVGGVEHARIFETGIRLANTGAYRGFDAGAVERFMLRFTADRCEVGSTNNETKVVGSNLIEMQISGGGIIGTWQSDGLVLSDTMQLRHRNNADTADLILAGRSNTSDVLLFGDENSANSQYRANSSASSHRFFSANIETFRMGNINGVTGGAAVVDRNNVLKVVGFRHPTRLTINTTQTIQQDMESQNIQITSGNPILSLNVLTEGTAIRFWSTSGTFQIILGAAANFRWLNGDGGLNNIPNGITVQQNGIVELMWATTATVYVFGNGISAN